MKTMGALLLLLVLLLPSAFAQEFTRRGLPEGAVVRLGKGNVGTVRYSPDGTRLAVGGSATIWIYDTTTSQEVAVLTGHTSEILSVAFSPDGKMPCEQQSKQYRDPLGYRDG